MNFRKWNPLDRSGWGSANRRRDRQRHERNPSNSEGGKADISGDLASSLGDDLGKHGHDQEVRFDLEKGVISRRRLAQGLGMACAGLGMGFGGRASGQPVLGLDEVRGGGWGGYAENRVCG